ncbi:hypothetical protein NUW58_g6531 [Xylaria curta]|uniref:Uncharacterized protein n=1 Tax=Xylaria curta TaxID=42375 RepID=A0ACC1NUF3_9PEZI|nr:hypothetical protein NUW58_g6531 [Xylaria curta]
MAEPQPRTISEGATGGDVEEEVTKAKSAEDRKAAAALASMDSNGDGAQSAEVDAAAVSKLGTAVPVSVEKKEVKKVKVDAADVALLSRRAAVLCLGLVKTASAGGATKENAQGNYTYNEEQRLIVVRRFHRSTS